MGKTSSQHESGKIIREEETIDSKFENASFFFCTINIFTLLFENSVIKKTYIHKMNKNTKITIQTASVKISVFS